MANSRHKQHTERSVLRKFGIPAIAAVATVAIGAVAVQLPADNAGSSSVEASQSKTNDASDEATRTPARESDERPSRDQQRKSLDSPSKNAQQPAAGAGKAPEPTPEPQGSMYATTELNIRSGPGDDYDVVDTVETGTKLKVTDETDGEWTEIVYEDESRWVTSEYLAKKKPADEAEDDDSDADDSGSDDGESSGGLSTAECASGSSVESGINENAIAVHRAVCAEFPEVTSFGGLRPGDDGEHGTGQALDIMITGSTGDEIADFVRSNAGALGVSEVLWEQQIWTVERSSEGWRPMEDRGSTTANHFDHVHVTVY